MQVADLANVFPTETMEAGTVLFGQGCTYGDRFIVQVDKVELSRQLGGSVQRGIFVGASEIQGSTRPCSRMTRAILPNRC